MTIAPRTVTIWCDGCGNWEEFPTIRVRTAVMMAKEKQWVARRIDGRDQHYCNHCVATGTVPSGGRT